MEGYFSHLLENPRGLSWSWRIKDAKCCFIPGQRRSTLAIYSNMYIPKYCPSPSLFHGHVFHLPWEAGSSEVPGLETKHLHSTSTPCFPRRKKSHALWDARAAPKGSNPITIKHPCPGNEVFPPESQSPNTPLGVTHTHTHAQAPRKGSEILPLLLKGGRGTPRPRQPLLAGSIWLQLPAAARWNARQQSLLLRGPGEQTGHYIYTLKGVTHPDTTARQPDKHRR